MKRFLVTGIGRSGTKYAANMLTAAGLPCAWEKAFFAGKRNPKWSEPGGEASWFAMPSIADLPDDTVVLHQTREPIAWLRSWLQLSAKWSPGVKSFVEDHCGFYIWERAPHPASDMQVYVNWQRRVEETAAARKLPYLRYRLEDLDADLVGKIFELVGAEFNASMVKTALSTVPRSTNAMRAPDPRFADLGWDTLPRGPEFDAFAEMAVRYGYEGPR